MSQQGLRQASVRAVTGTTFDYNGDWHALFTLAGIPDGDFNGRLLAWINLKLGASYSDLPAAMAALAAATGATNFSSMGTFDASLTLTPLLDPYSTGLTGAWSAWQRLRTSYVGPARRLRRSSDNAEADIGFTALNVLDEAAVAAHVGGGSGFDVTLYDQSGNARDFTQATATAQPGYTTIGSQSRPALNFDRTSDVMATAAVLGDFIDAGSGYVIAACIVDAIDSDNATDASANDLVVGNLSGDIGLTLRQTGTLFQAWNWDGNEDLATAALTLSAIQILEWRHEGGNVYARLNGANEASVASGNTSVSGVMKLGQRTGGTGFADMKLSDVIVYDAVPSLAARDAIVAALIARLT
jgi:hypothetical protein